MSSSLRPKKPLPSVPLSARARANKFRQWKRQFKVIERQITELALRRFIYRAAVKLIEANPRIQVRSAFYDWMHAVYVIDMTVSIRRLVDWHPRTISFIKLLEDVAQHPEVISRRRFTHPYKKGMKRFGHRDYERFAKPGGNVLDTSIVTGHRKILIRSQKGLRKFLNTHIAHLDKHRRNLFPTHAELERCLDTLELLVKEYAKLFEHVVLLHVAPTIQYDWMAPFRVAWLPDEETHESATTLLPGQDKSAPSGPLSGAS